VHEQSKINKKAWEYRAYEFWNKRDGSPEEKDELTYMGFDAMRVKNGIRIDGTLTNYRILFEELGLTRKDCLGESGIYRLKL